MPLYEYRCTSCGEHTEVLQHLGDAPPSHCPRCGGALEKVPTAPALQFKGTGWYVTDYANRHTTGAEKGKDEGGKGRTEDGKGVAETAKPAANTSTAAAPAPKP